MEITRVIEAYRYDIRFLEGPTGRGATRFRLSNVHTPAIYTDQECEKPLGYEAKAFVEGFIKGKRLKARDVRRGRDDRSWVGRIEAEGEDLAQALLQAGLAVPYNDSWRNPTRRAWTCDGGIPEEVIRGLDSDPDG
jgi:endonuclease YncB( thermonuclease family)